MAVMLTVHEAANFLNKEVRCDNRDGPAGAEKGDEADHSLMVLLCLAQEESTRNAGGSNGSAEENAEMVAESGLAVDGSATGNGARIRRMSGGQLCGGRQSRE